MSKVRDWLEARRGFPLDPAWEESLREGFEKDPTNLKLLQNLMCFYVLTTKMRKAMSLWEDHAKGLDLSPEVIEGFYIPTITCLLYHNNLHEAQKLLSFLGSEVVSQDPGLYALRQDCGHSLLAEEIGYALFPYCVPYEDIWKGPHFGPFPCGYDLWTPGFVTSVEEGQATLLLGQHDEGEVKVYLTELPFESLGVQYSYEVNRKFFDLFLSSSEPDKSPAFTFHMEKHLPKDAIPNYPDLPKVLSPADL